MNETIQETIEVAPNTIVRAVYTHVGPEDAPANGSEWPDELDYPRVTVRLELPCDGNRLVDYLAVMDARVFTVQLSSTWGTYEGGVRYAIHCNKAHSVKAAYLACKADVSEAIATLRGLLDQRNARLDKRLATIQAARVGSPFKHTD